MTLKARGVINPTHFVTFLYRNSGILEKRKHAKISKQAHISDISRLNL